MGTTGYNNRGLYNKYDKHHRERDKLDYYATPTAEIENILRILDINFSNQTILEPCIGGGHMAKGIDNYIKEKGCFDVTKIGTDNLNIPTDNYNSHHFAILENDEIVGYVKYNINYIAKCANSFGIISFKPNVTFGKDLLQIIDNIFNKHNMNKIEFHCASSNPVARHYYKFIEKFGGRVVGILNESVALDDNTINDEIIFEMFKRDYNKRR